MARVVLALVPHPDDLEFYADGTFARLIAEGVCGMIVIATNGSKGSYESEAEPLVRIRRAEAQRAAAVLGAESPLMLGHQDMELENLAPDVLREQFIRLIRQHKPDVLIAQDPTGCSSRIPTTGRWPGRPWRLQGTRPSHWCTPNTDSPGSSPIS